MGRKEEGGRGSGEIDRTAPNLEHSVKPTREKGRRGTSGGAEGRKGGGGGRGQLLRRRVPGAGERALGLQGGKGSGGREGSGGDARCAAALAVSLWLERVAAWLFLPWVSPAAGHVCLSGFCYMGGGFGEDWVTEHVAVKAAEAGGTRRGGEEATQEKGKEDAVKPVLCFLTGRKITPLASGAETRRRARG